MTDTDDLLADPALYGLEGRMPGSPCPTACARDCMRGCHEAHKATGLLHDPYYCQQLTLGRDVSEFEPEVRQWWETELRAARAQAERGLFGALFSTPEDGVNLFDEEPGSFGRGVPWRVRLLAWLRGVR